ncbi:MAG: cupin domain-containing protein [Candidatus Bathyarchaeia archaeon]|nr:cupin domain-containing protein [Candidatus Bathyarchaeota archaeon]
MKGKWVDLGELIEYPQGGILSKELVKTSEANITLFCMSKGTEISEHTSTKEGFLIVLEGKGSFNLEGEDIAMKPGVLIFIGKNAIHSLRADENTAFILSLCGGK